MVDNTNGQYLTNIFILNNNKSITYLKDELIYKIDWFDNRKIISLIKHFSYMLESSPFIDKFEDHMIKYLNDRREEIINLLTSLTPKTENDLFIDQKELKLELKLSTKIRLINCLMNNCIFFGNFKVYTNATRLNLICDNTQLVNELSKLNILNLKGNPIEVNFNVEETFEDPNLNFNLDTNRDDYSITDLSNNKCDLIYVKNQTAQDSNNNLIQSTSNNEKQSIIDDEKNDSSFFNLSNVMMNMDDDFTFLKDNQINDSQIDLINLNNVLKENDQSIEFVDTSRRKFRKSTGSQNSGRIPKTIKNILNDDVDVENHLKSHYTVSKGDFVTLEEVYDTFMENFDVNKQKNSIKSSIGKCIKKLFNNNGQIKVLNKVIDGKSRSIYFNLKAN